MILNQNAETAANRFTTICTNRGRSRRPLEPCSGIASAWSWALIATAAVLFVCQPVLAQTPRDSESRTVVAASALKGTLLDLPDAPRTTIEAGGRSTDPANTTAPTATISGTVLDVNGGIIPGAIVVLNTASAGEQREVTSDDLAAFRFDALTPGVPYEITINLKGFSSWSSAPIVLEPSQSMVLDDIHLKITAEETSVTVYGGSAEDIAVAQVQIEEQQRVFGFIPNFYVAYDGAKAEPLSTKLKFKLAMKVATDPVTILGVGFMSGIDHAANTPDYRQGAKGFGQRFGANAAGEFSDILIGGALLPSLLHQDPRYFYQGTGSTSSRFKHAIGGPFLCRGDNGQRQINYSSIGGNIGSTALSMTWLPDSNRGAGMVFTQFGISSVERIVADIAQEFILPRFTPSLKRSR